ncbi:hypothetical protein PTTG_04842 [Puccinia triticina 1-1 BBBD Race 1]|uniref:Uncharacterized protein n=1 Tax=Puccinia triticina (isolate 1-1 / race 1 (BBBD)) TaxID=630390 RepID=A0A0C4EVK6_PUCT1|nr:hypothetical protein PTTG_04842 [Puccinia triticina 1-1 BBBD Race 1]
MPKKWGRPRKQETWTAVCSPPISAPDLSAAPLVPPPATAPARMDAGASAKRFRPIKKIPDNHRKGHIGDANKVIPAAPAPVGSVVNKKKEKTKEASSSVVKKPPTASDFQPCPLDDADWDQIEAYYWNNKAGEKAVREKDVGKKAVREKDVGKKEIGKKEVGKKEVGVQRSGRKVRGA